MANNYVVSEQMNKKDEEEGYECCRGGCFQVFPEVTGYSQGGNQWPDTVRNCWTKTKEQVTYRKFPGAPGCFAL